MTKHEIIFTQIYENCIWGNDQNNYYKGSSGFGSLNKILQTTYIPFVRNFIALNKIKSIVDLGCGNFELSDKIFSELKNIKYTGYDVYKDLIDYNKEKFKDTKQYNFSHLDFFNQKNQIIDADLFIIKDVFQHWSNNEIRLFLHYFLQNIKYRFILISNTFISKVKQDIKTGEYRPISALHYPLNKFNPIILFYWGDPNLYSEQKDSWDQHIIETSIIINKSIL